MRNPVLFLCALITAALSCVAPAAPAKASTSATLSWRAVWLTRNELLAGRDNLTTRIQRLKEAGFTDVLVLTQMRGYTALAASKVLPQWPELASKDPHLLDWLVPAIHAQGMRAHAWTEYGFYAYWTPDIARNPGRGPLLDKHPELTALTGNGTPYLRQKELGYFFGLCPSNPQSHDLLRALYLEMLEQHPFDGINLDRIRFTDGTFCHCDYCRKQFRADTGITLKAEFTTGSREAGAWDEWRRAQTRRFVRGLSREVRKKHPGKMLTSAVVPPEMIPEKGQDWPTWIEQNLVDGVMPMLYGRKILPGVEWTRKRLGGDDSRVWYGVDAGQGGEVLRRQAADLRAAGARGITVWEAGSLEKAVPGDAAGLFDFGDTH